MTTRTARANKKRMAEEDLAPQGVLKAKEEVPVDPFLEEPIQISLSRNNNLNVYNSDADFDLDEFPDGTEDIPLAKKRENNPQDWKKVGDVYEFLKVYMYGLLEHNELFISHFAKDGEYIYKCAEPSCKARLKIEVHEPKKDQDHEGKSSKAFTSEMLKKSFDLKVPKLVVHRSNQHENHKEEYQKNCIKRLKDVGIHPLVKLIIEKHELYYLRPKQILSNLRDKDEIEEKYLPTKVQIASYISYLTS